MGDLSILVVSCDIGFRDYLCNYLLMDGYYVEVADRVSTALCMLQGMQYDLVLLNISEFGQEKEVILQEEVMKINPNSELIFLLNPNVVRDSGSSILPKPQNCLIRPFLLEDLPYVLEKVAQRKYLRTNNQDRIDNIKREKGERRKSLRIKSDIPIKYTFISPLGNIPSEENISKIINISLDGIMFRVDIKTKFSDFVYLNILLPTSSNPINIIGKIKWDCFNSLEPWRYIGVKFSNLNFTSKKEIKSFIESNCR